MSRSNFIVRIILVGFFFSSVFTILILQLYRIQIHRHPELYSKAKKTYTSVSRKEGQRGEIYDINGNLLVGNIPCTDICADPQLTGDEKRCREIALFFSKELDVSYPVIFRRLLTKTRKNQKIRYAVIKKDVDLNKAKKIEERIKELKFEGIIFQNKTKRYYPKNELLSNILGFINVDSEKIIPVIGVEKAFDKDFSPTEANSRYERDKHGIPLAYGDKQINEVRDGNSVYLTISEPIQTIVEEELDKLMEEFQPKAAFAIMVDPHTGNIFAIAQRPSFDPNNRASMNPENWRDRIITDVFEPGSIMKPITISGALDYGVVTPNTLFDCEKGYWFYAGKPLRDAHPLAILPVSQIIQKSSNIGAAKVAIKMGKNRLYQTFKRFGFGQPTGIPLKPEATGIFRSANQWDPLSITRFPIGQGIAVSPLQMVRAYCALANGGRLVKLRLIDREKNPETGEFIKKSIPASSRIFLRNNTHQEIVNMLKLTTQEGGTATRAAIEGYDVAGKTGTSQKWVDGAYSNTQFTASFIGFVPADNPAFLLLIMADEPEKNHYGGIVATPAFRRIAKKTLRYLNIPPKYKIPDEDVEG